MSQLVVGNYTLGELLGRGGMSDVYAATHRYLGDPVAVKLLRGDGGDELVAEATGTRAIQHRNVVRVLDVGRDAASGRCYLVMERVGGENLAARLRRVKRLPEGDVRALGAAIADGMQAAHDRGIVHRDLKPANVMLAGDEPKIVDFGIAKFLGDAGIATTGRRVGTPPYMAPEQFTGGVISPAVDVFALGVILYEAATGRTPWTGYDDGRCPQLFEAAAPADGISDELADLLARCLAREPRDRPRSMSEIAAALRGETADERITVTGPPPLVAPAPAPGARWPIVAIVAGLVVLIGLLAFALTRGGEPKKLPVPEAAPPPQPTIETPAETETATATETAPPKPKPKPSAKPKPKTRPRISPPPGEGLD